MVMAICGCDGMGGPVCVTVIPLVNRAAERSNPETNCELDDASMCTFPPGGVSGTGDV